MLGSYDSFVAVVAAASPGVPVVVEPYGLDALAAVYDAFSEPTPILLVGERDRLKALADEVGLSPRLTGIIDCASTAEAVEAAASLVSSAEADFVVKGSIATADLLKGLLGRERLGSGHLASHLYIIDAPTFPDRTLAFADAGVNVAPDLEAKVGIVQNSVEALHRLGIAQPLVAMLSAVEVVKPAIPSTVDAAILSTMSTRGQFGRAIVDGPLSLDTATSKTAATNKALVGAVAGQADLLVAPNIDAANIASKALIGARGTAMGVVLGCTAPIAVPSRGDSRKTRSHSILLASFLARHHQHY